MKRRLLLQSTILAVGLIAAPAMAQTTPPATDKSGDQPTTPEIVVTGVFTAHAIEKAPISINVVTSKQLEKQQPVSAADLLKNIPGVFVNSGLGEIRNIVFSRGVSANSLEAAGGYYYVSMQEDGLPTDLVTSGNYGPDYFLRSDITLSRLEGLRGGTAVITGPNAPGGIFNYISKTGKSDPGVEVQGKLGLEANGKAPYYRIDAYAGGKLSGQDLYYSIGGFYRADDGPHPAGYQTNRGGQVKANLLWDYGTGSVLVTGKYLNDRNDWVEFTPAYGATQIAPGFNNASSDLPPANSAHCYIATGGSKQCWDPSNLVHSQSLAFGVTWKQDLSSNVHFENKARYSYNHTHWNNGTVISLLSLTDPAFNYYNGLGFMAGTLNYYNHNTGQLAATVNSLGFPGGATVVTNNLPNANLMPTGDAVYGLAADDETFASHQFVDQATLTADLGHHHLALGGYVGFANLTHIGYNAGLGLMTLTNKPAMLDVTWTDAGGTVHQVTDSGGWTADGKALGGNSWGTQHQYTVFFGDTWEVAPRLTIDAGGRYEAVRYNIINATVVNPLAANPYAFLTAGGADGNPLTVYDNNISVAGPNYTTQRNFSYFNYSGSVTYEVSDSVNAYIRYSSGKKAPDFEAIGAINTPNLIATDYPDPQKMQQVELGVKYHNRSLDLQFFPFYSLLSNVNTVTSQFFTYKTGPQVGQIYIPPAVEGSIKTFGIEIAATARLLPTLTGQANLTLQDAQARHFGSYTQGPIGDGSDDQLTILSGDAENNPKIMFRGGLNWTPIDKVNLFTQLTYTGKRPANAANAFYMPGFATVDLGGAWQVTPRVKAQFNVTNLFNQLGVLSFARKGFLDGLNREGLLNGQYHSTDLYSIIPAQARAFYLTVSVKL